MTSTTTHTLGAVARSLIEGPTNWINGAWEEGQGANTLTWLEYDPKNDLLYVMKMGSDLYKMPRAK